MRLRGEQHHPSGGAANALSAIDRSAEVSKGTAAQRYQSARSFVTTGQQEMKHTSHKTLALVSGLLLLVFVGVGLAGGQGRPAKAATKKPAPQHRSRVTSQQAPSKWYTFTSPDSDFIILFPAEPRRDEDLPGEVAALRGYSHYGDTMWLSVSFEDLGFQTDSPQANELGPNIDEIMARYTNWRGGKILRVQRLALNVLELERVVPARGSNKDRYVMSRLIYTNSRLYTLGCVPRVDGQQVDKRMCRRFFNSFRIIGVPQ